MDTKIFQQSINLVAHADAIAIVPSLNPDGDTIGACGGLSLALGNTGKKTQILVPGSFFAPEKYAFLPLFSKLFCKSREVALSISCPAVASVRYEKTEGGLVFFIAPKSVDISLADIALKPSFVSPDLFITVGVSDRENLGASFPESARVFFDTPIINIDNNPANEKFGTTNLLSFTSSSKTEVVKKLVDGVAGEKNILDEKSATYLLFGIVCATKNFQSPKTNPSSLLCAASLILKGAKHQDIVQHLYKTKPFEGLKTLGEVMKRLTKEGGVVWASFTGEECRKLSLTPRNLAFAAEELKDSFLNPVSLLLLWEKSPHQSRLGTLQANPGGTEGILFSPSENILAILAEKIGGEVRQGLLFFSLPRGDLVTLEQKLTAFLRAHLPKIE